MSAGRLRPSPTGGLTCSAKIPVGSGRVVFKECFMKKMNCRGGDRRDCGIGLRSWKCRPGPGPLRRGLEGDRGVRAGIRRPLFVDG